MPAKRSYYPPSPRDVPVELTAAGGAYRLQVFLLLCGILLFFLVYLGLLAVSPYAIYRGIVMPVERATAKSDVTWKVVLIALGTLIFLFLLKGFFKRQRVMKSLDIEITPGEQPRL